MTFEYFFKLSLRFILNLTIKTETLFDLKHVSILNLV